MSFEPHDIYDIDVRTYDSQSGLGGHGARSAKRRGAPVGGDAHGGGGGEGDEGGRSKQPRASPGYGANGNRYPYGVYPDRGGDRGAGDDYADDYADDYDGMDHDHETSHGGRQGPTLSHLKPDVSAALSSQILKFNQN